MLKQPAIFLDSDGTIIQDMGYLKKPKYVKFFSESFTALQRLQEGFLLFIQSGISKGITSANEVKLVNEYVVEILKSKGKNILHVFCYPHSVEDNCICKKPNPYFIHKAAKLYNLNLIDSYIISDHLTDVECGTKGGIKHIYVLTGHGKKQLNELTTDFKICYNIIAA